MSSSLFDEPLWPPFFFVEICDSSVLVFIAGGKKTQVNDVVVILGILIVRFEIG